MKGMTKVRSELSTKLVLLQGDVDLNNDQISRLQEQNAETLGQIAAVEKVLELIGSAWSPPKKATKKFVKKVAKKPAKKVAKKAREPVNMELSYALARDKASSTPVLELLNAYEEDTANGARMTITQLFHAVNARRDAKVNLATFRTKLRNLRNSPHKELSSIFSVSRGEDTNFYLECNSEAAKAFRKLVK